MRISDLVALVLCAAVAITGAPCVQGASAASGNSKKLIQFGWGMPTPDFIVQHLSEMEKTPFDGVVVSLHAGLPIFKHAPYPEAVYAADRSHLGEIKSRRLTDNLLAMWATSDKNWHWENDSDWAAAQENVRNFAQLARSGGLRGIFLDTETYGPNPWDPRQHPEAARIGFSDYSVQVRQRGRQFMRSLQAALPAAKVVLTWGPVSVLARLHAPAPGPARDQFLAKCGYGLLPAFVAGLLDASSDGNEVIDGHESSYYYLSNDEFSKAQAQLKQSAIKEIARATGPYHASRYHFGAAIYLDWLVDPSDSPKTFGHYLDTEQQRLMVLRHNVYYALLSSDEYVWVYSEKLNWWKGNIPAGLAEAIGSAKDQAATGQPLDLDATAVISGARARYQRGIRW